MIFNKSVFKKLLKEAYKSSGLLVANKNGRIVLAGGWWVMTMAEGVFTKEGKAVLVELTGQLPEVGECFRCTSAGNQIEIPPDYIDIDEAASGEAFKKTIMTMDGPFGGMLRIYQRENDIVCINEIVKQLLDSSAALEDESNCIDGPYTRTPEFTGMLYWHTGECSFAACPIECKDSAEEFIEEVQKVNIPQSKR